MEVLELDDEERDRLLIRMDTRQEIMTEAIMDLKKGMYGEDGQGVCVHGSRNLRTSRVQSSHLSPRSLWPLHLPGIGPSEKLPGVGTNGWQKRHHRRTFWHD